MVLTMGIAVNDPANAIKGMIPCFILYPGCSAMAAAPKALGIDIPMSKLQAECELAVGSEAYGNDAVVRGSLGPSPSTDRLRSTRRVTELSEHKLSAACVAWRGVTAYHVFWTKRNKKGRARGNNVIIMSIRKCSLRSAAEHTFFLTDTMT